MHMIPMNWKKRCKIIYPKKGSSDVILLEYYSGEQMYGFKKITKAEFTATVEEILKAFNPVFLEIENCIMTLVEGMADPLADLAEMLEKDLDNLEDLEPAEEDDSYAKD